MSLSPLLGILGPVPPTINPSAAIDNASLSGTIVIQPPSSVTITTITDGIATLSGGTLSGLLPPQNPGDAANKAYVDAFIGTPTSWKTSVKAATTGNLTLAGNQTIDFVTLLTGDRVLIKNQTTGSQNGIYVVDTAGPWQRSFDMLAGSSAAASAVFVQNGLVNGTIGFLCTNNSGLDIVGVASLAWIPFSGNSLSAGIGLSRVSDTLNVNLDNASLGTTSGNSLQILPSGVTSDKLATGSVTDAKVAGPISIGKLSASSVTVATSGGIVGGTASLGGTLALACDATVLRTSGNQARSGTLALIDTTQSSSPTTGALTVAGGVGVGKNLWVAGALTAGQVAATGGVSGASVTDGTFVATGGNLSGCVSIATQSLTNGSLVVAGGNISGATVISGTLLTDGYTTLTGGNIVADGDITSISYLNGGLTITGGNISGAGSIGTTSLTASGTVAVGTLTDGYASLSEGTLTGLSPPQAPGDATNKAYVDGLLQGLYWKQEVLAATTGNLASLSGPQTVDGVALVAGNRVLVKDQTSAVANGIYVVAAGAWARSSDMAAGSSASGTAVAVNSGTANANSGYTCTNLPGSGVVGSDPLTFIRFATIQSVTAGAGLTETANTLSVNVDNTSIDILGNNLEIRNLGVTNAKLAAGSVTDAKITGPISIGKLSASTVTVGTSNGLSGGGTANLGGSLTLGCDATVLRTSGNQVRSGTLALTDVTQSGSPTTGALTVAGGVGVAKNLWVAGTLTGASVTDGTFVATGGNLSGVGTLGATTVNVSGTVYSSSIGNSGTVTTSGLACNSITAATLTGLTNLTLTGTLGAATVTDGVASLSGGALTGLSSLSGLATLGVSGAVACGSLSASGVVAGGSLSASGSVACGSLAATGLVAGGSLSATGSVACGSLAATGTVSGATVTDGVASLSGGSLTGLVGFSATNLTASGTVTAGTVSATTANISGTVTSNRLNTGIVSATGAIGTTSTMSAVSLTTGGTVVSNGSVTGLVAPVNGGDAANKTYVDTKTMAVNYSTSEVSMGVTWIDGKTVYQKVLNMGSLPGLGGSTTVNHGITTPQTWVTIRMMCTSGGTTYTTPDYGTEISGNTLAITFRARGSGWSGYTGVAILQYTKV